MTARRVALGSDPDPVSPLARMSLLVTRTDDRPTGLVVVIHGRNGAAEAPHMRMIAAPYLARGMIVVAPDLCNSEHNASAGTGADFTLAEHLRDAARAVDWVRAAAPSLGWPGATICLAGHSMGAYAAALLAATTARAHCRHLLLVSPFVSGRLQIEARARASADGLTMLARELPQAFFDWPRHDLLRHVDTLTMPTATVVGAVDTVTPPGMVEGLARRLPCPAGHTVLPAAHHCLEGGPHDEALAEAVDRLERAAG